MQTTITEKYAIEVQTFAELRDKIEIPKFQRGLVWSETKKREFIKTLKAGLPIGVLLLSQKGEKYLVIDGLQRFTTMKDYARDYFSYIDKSEISDIDLMSIIMVSADARENFENYKEDIKKKQFDEMRSIFVKHIANAQTLGLYAVSQEIAKELCQKIAVLPQQDILDIIGVVFKLVDRIDKQAQIDSLKIPLIIFKGKEDELADIFQKLNQEGVRLSKYDVFAATWINHSVVVKDDPSFIEFIIAKYTAAQQDSDLEIDSFDPDEMKQSGELTVFEYAYAVGKALKNKCKKLFPKEKDAKIDSIGFLILAELLGLTYQEMGKLAQIVDTYKGTVDFKKLKDAIIEAAAIVESALVPYIESPVKPKSGARVSLVCHSELQMASYIIVAFKLKYELSINSGLIQKNKYKELQAFKQYIPRHYLYDIIRGYWSGSGDSKLEEIIADPATCRYIKDVPQANFEMEVGRWLSDNNKKTSLPNVSAEAKLFLNYLLRYSGVYDERFSYDVEHCVPKDVIKKYFSKKNIVVPMSAVCNLVYIPASDNRGKGELTYYQKQAQDPGTYHLNQQQLDGYGYPSRADLKFVEAVDTLTEKNYFDFLEKQRKIILSKFIKALYGC